MDFRLRLCKECCFSIFPVPWAASPKKSITGTQTSSSAEVSNCFDCILPWGREFPGHHLYRSFFPLEKELSYQNEMKMKANLRKDCCIFTLTIGYGWDPHDPQGAGALECFAQYCVLILRAGPGPKQVLGKTLCDWMKHSENNVLKSSHQTKWSLKYSLLKKKKKNICLFERDTERVQWGGAEWEEERELFFFF